MNFEEILQTLTLCDVIVNKNLIHFLIPYVTFGGGGRGGNSIFLSKKKRSMKTMEKHPSTGFSSRRRFAYL